MRARLRKYALKVFLTIAIDAGFSGSGYAQVSPPGELPASTPAARIFRLSSVNTIEQLYAFLEPCQRRAMAAFGGIKERYRRGLPPHQNLFVVTRLHDERKNIEQVFVVVDSIAPEWVVGRISSTIRNVQGYQEGQLIALADSLIVDWMITRPDGSEEGNLMGKVLDQLQAQGEVSSRVCREQDR